MAFIHHFEEPGRRNLDPRDSNSFWLPSETFTSVLDTIVITCVDLLFVHKTDILLGKRNCEPIHGWWVVGGRMYAGESPIDAVQRKAREEAGLSIGRSPIQFLGVYSTAFATRRQPPTENGLHSVNLAHIITLSDHERVHIALTNQEYDAWRWVSPETIGDVLDRDRALDQFVYQMASDCWNALG
ncbi:MAG: NUDIX domain-containing protein [Leptolyngbyaceae bacterium]|nr:NUDIX domain-containing protein [Leptolyngbyaceae bacterium]